MIGNSPYLMMCLYILTSVWLLCTPNAGQMVAFFIQQKTLAENKIVLHFLVRLNIELEHFFFT